MNHIVSFFIKNRKRSVHIHLEMAEIVGADIYYLTNNRYKDSILSLV